MDSLSKLQIDYRKKLLRIFLLELSQFELICDRDRFLLKTIHQHLNLQPEVITDVKNEVRKLMPSKRKTGKIDLQSILLSVKTEIADEMDKKLAMWFLETLKNLLNVGGTISESFIQDLYSDYLPDNESTPNSMSTNIQGKDFQKNRNQNLQNPVSKSEENTPDMPNNYEPQKPIISSSDQLTNIPKSAATEQKTNPPIEAKFNDQNNNDPFKESKLEFLIEILQRLIFPVRDAMITSLKVDTTMHGSSDIEDHIASIQMRLIALIMDCLIVAFGLLIPAACIIPIAVLLQTVNLEMIAVIFTLLPGVAIIFYFLSLEYNYQATLGKQWMGLRICADSGKKLGSKISLMRIVFKMLPIISSSLATLFSFVYPPLMSLAVSLTLLFWFFIICSAGLVFVTRKSKGLHDILFKTLVIYSDKIPK